MRHLWDLALLLGQCSGDRQLRERLLAAGRGVPAGSSTATELAGRIAESDAELARLTAGIKDRAAHLRRLVDEIDAFVAE